MKTILKLENVVKKFSGLVAVEDLTIEMAERSIHALIGPNGSGKTTTINLITGVLPLTSGVIRFNDTVISGMPTYKIAQKGIGRTFQNLKLFNSMTVIENLMVGGHQMTKMGMYKFLFDCHTAKREEKILKERAREVLTFIGIDKWRNEKVSNLPYGRQKMTELGRALMMKPKLLLLDEPAGGLNPSERVEFVNILLKTYDLGIDLLLIEHNMDVVMNVSNKITVLNFGKKIAEGSPEEIQKDNEVIKAYLGEKYASAVRVSRGD
ncbi:leucine/isoleucine/valine transporter subunit; ATP-binding component of ABC superfamily [Tepidanaerobacter acetatoxydans Re1]|uniref:Leucine/isoleucine/valine transporter subunit ATP-binding component of ABC superfamily n=1 Tax=Tepidanaerobacter acetatoxydans (strain DSM 21804 / JCM 16047 / Re1) TaxID=1209989 RepID=F4LXL2_TEPAE|nr:ABC transporter ATP-binding protein [Tepidanaerobacter acetatoxydans]AEE91941.1 Monosaccharide-transporting ATPase [Tepidanaerobacter acetatoxydans Re1]CCP26768.1 leucine/isoleucine/valine transporter subunit; ATP-binding component of ABC superfamily [Tepidanaerobacter acetatoxydans Re1]